MSPFLALARKWEETASKQENRGVTVTMMANTHRLFANELKTVVKHNSEAVFSWNGHTVYGDKASIEAVLKLVLAKELNDE